MHIYNEKKITQILYGFALLVLLSNIAYYTVERIKTHTRREPMESYTCLLKNNRAQTIPFIKINVGAQLSRLLSIEVCIRST